MRADGNEPSIELSFDCGAAPGALKRADVGQMVHVRHEVLTGSVQRTATGAAIVPPPVNGLILNLKGTLLARTASTGRLVLIPPRSLTYVRHARFIVQAARGEHYSHLISWENKVTPLLYAWMEERNRARNAQSPVRSESQVQVRNMACRPIDPLFRDAVERFHKAVDGPPEVCEPLVVSFLYEVVSRLMADLDQVQLAAAPLDLPETIKELTLKVRQSPANPWPLREAADMAGYSPFHFSRVFKNLVGYGFHEYVDRCRTECAVEMLVTTDSAVDLVASTCGFGTTQGLRESVKEYLGLVPSELRNVPDTMDFGN